MQENNVTLLNHPSLLEALVSHTLLPADGGISEFDFLILPRNTIQSPFFAENFIQGIENQYGTQKLETPKFRVSFLFHEYRTGLFANTQKQKSSPGMAITSTKGGAFT